MCQSQSTQVSTHISTINFKLPDRQTLWQHTRPSFPDKGSCSNKRMTSKNEVWISDGTNISEACTEYFANVAKCLPYGKHTSKIQTPISSQ